MSVDIEFDQVISGQLTTPQEIDEFRFVVPEGTDGRYFFEETTCPSQDHNLRLVAPDGSVALNGVRCDSRTLTLDQPGEWLLQMRGERFIGAYSFQIIDIE